MSRHITALVLLAVLFAGCSTLTNTTSPPLQNPNTVAGSAYLWQLEDHSNIRVSLSGISDTGFDLQRQGRTDAVGNWSIERVPNGTYTLAISGPYRSGPNGSGSIGAVPTEMTIRVEYEPLVIDPVTLPVYSDLSLTARDRPGLIIHSQDDWEFTGDPNEADLFLDDRTLSTPGRDDLVYLPGSSIRRGSYWLGHILDFPTSGYTESGEYGGNYMFRTRDGRYVKMRTDSARRVANIQFVIMPDDAEDGVFPY